MFDHLLVGEEILIYDPLVGDGRIPFATNHLASLQAGDGGPVRDGTVRSHNQSDEVSEYQTPLQCMAVPKLKRAAISEPSLPESRCLFQPGQAARGPLQLLPS